MSAASIPRTPQLHTAADLKTAIDRDHREHGIACVVEVDVWAPEASPRGSPRITIELGDGIIGEPAPFHYQPGAWWPVLPTPANLGPLKSTLAPGSTVTPSLAGTPSAGGAPVVLCSAGGTTGTAGVEVQVSYDGGTTYADPIALGTDTSIAVLGVTLSLGSALIITAGDSFAWTQRRATGDVARPLLDNAQSYRLSIHVPSPPDVASANRPATAQDATDQLMRATMVAIRRQLAAPFRATAKVNWPKRIEGYDAFVYGSLCVVDLVIGSPILDDAVAKGQAIQFSVSGTVQFGDGSSSPTESASAQG